MRFLWLILLFNFLQIVNLLAQSKKSYPFIVEGSINVDTGTVKLFLVNDTSYYPKSARNFSAKIKHGKFTISGNIPYPQAFSILLKPFHLSAPFLVGAGIQKVNINTDSISEVPKSNSYAMHEYYKEYIPAFAKMWLESKIFSARWELLFAQYHKKFPDSLQTIFNQERNKNYAKSDSVLLSYVAAHPKSFWGLWTLVNLNNFGYHPWFDSIYAHFSDSLKNTLTGRVLHQKLIAESVLNEGSHFPYISSVDRKYKKLEKDYFRLSKYTLVDFWYSHCGSCISQFPALNVLYKKYRLAGFNIISITTDATKYRKNWLLQINLHKPLWAQYWDINGRETAKLSINAFPTNFLLDRTGKIIKRNLSPDELKTFLENSL
jgi:thiol-disulfide isomerase/thioredoxin